MQAIFNAKLLIVALNALNLFKIYAKFNAKCLISTLKLTQYCKSGVESIEYM